MARTKRTASAGGPVQERCCNERSESGDRRWRGPALLGAAMALLLAGAAGCVPGEKQPPPDAVERQDGPTTPYPEPIQVSVWAGVNDVMGFAPGESIDDNLHTRFMKSYLNIEFVNKWVEGGNKIGEKVNLDIASNDLPDFVQVSMEQLTRMMKNDQLEDVTDVWDNYALPGLKENMGYQNNIAFAPATKDGRIYGIPLPYDMGNSVALMYIRTDWLDAVNRDVPKTIDELDALVRAFALEDPDGNGKKDTFAVSFEQGSPNGGAGALPGGMTLDAVAAGFGVYPGLWLPRTATQSPDTLSYGSLDDKMLDVLRMFQAWYKLGAIDPEFAIKDLPRVADDVAAGKIGIVFGPFHYPLWPLRQALERNGAADWTVAPIPTLSGEEAAPKAMPFANNWVVVKKGFKHPEALVKALNATYMMQANIGEPGRFWEEAGRGEYKDLSAHLYMKPYHFDSPVRNIQAGREIRAALDNKDVGELKSTAAKNVYNNYILSSDPLLSWAFRKVFYDAEHVLAGYDRMQYSAFFDSPTPEMQTGGLALSRLEFEYITRIIMGAPLTEFDRFRTEWSALGGAKITQEVNQWYNERRQARKGLSP